MAPDADPAVDQRERQPCRARGDDEPDQRQEQRPTLRARLGERRTLGGERIRTRRQPHGKDAPRGDDERGDEEPQPERIERDRDCEPCREGDPRAAAVREIQGRDQHHRQGGRGGPGRRPLGTSEKPDGDQDAHDRVDAEAVPVADRIGEAVTRERIEGREPPGEQAREQRVSRDRENTCKATTEEQRHCSLVDDEQCQQHYTDVRKGSLRLEDGARGRVRPGRRDQRPAAEREQEREEGEVEPPEAATASGDEDRRRRHESQRRRPGPALGEIASSAAATPALSRNPSRTAATPSMGSVLASGWVETDSMGKVYTARSGVTRSPEPRTYRTDDWCVSYVRVAASPAMLSSGDVLALAE